MRPRGEWGLGLALSALLSCGPPPLQRAAIERVSAGPQPLAMTQVAQSQPRRPPWLSQGGQRAQDGYVFVGQGSAAAPEQAKQAAARDLLSAMSMFAGVDVQLASSDDTVAGPAGEVSVVRDQVELSATARWRGVVPDAVYWERYESPFAASSGRTDAFVRAWVPASSVALATGARRKRRATLGAPKSLVVLPFSQINDGASSGLSQALQHELTHQLSLGPWRSIDADAVQDAVQGLPGVQALWLDRVDEVFSPDLVITGLIDEDAQEIRVQLVRVQMDSGRPEYLGQVYAPRTHPELLSPQLLARLTAETEVSAGGTAATSAGAFEAQRQAQQLFAAGKNQRALERLYEALGEQPSGLSYLRAGRVLDRLGRYARVGPRARVQDPRRAQVEILTCTPEAERARKLAETQREEVLQRLHAPSPGTTWWHGSTPDYATLLRGLMPHVEAWARCGPEQMRCVDTCVPADKACPDVEYDLGLEAEWREVYGDTVEVSTTVEVRQGPHESYGLLPQGEGLQPQQPLRILQIDGSGHWWSVGPAPRGWVRKTELMPAPPQPLVLSPKPRSSAEAYLSAFEMARRQGSLRAQAEAVLAFATAGLRVDRRAGSLRLFRAVAARATRTSDPDLHSQALLGEARALRALGRRTEARETLQQALRIREAIGGQIDLLELYSELGGVTLELGDEAAARQALTNAWHLARQLGNAYLEVVVDNNLAVLQLRGGDGSGVSARFGRALDNLRDLGESQGTMAAALNVAFTHERAGEGELAAGLRAEAWRFAQEGAQLRWLAEVAAHRGLAPSAQRSGALVDLWLAALIYQELGLSQNVARMQDALLRYEVEEPGAADCVAQAYWKLKAPVFAAPAGVRPYPDILSIPPGDVAPLDLMVASNAACASLLSDWRPEAEPPRWSHSQAQGVLRFRDPHRPPPVIQGVVATVVLEEIEVQAQPGVSAGSAGEGPPSRPIVYRPSAEYDRILNTMVVQPDALLALTPTQLEGRLGGWRGALAPRVNRSAQVFDVIQRHAAHLDLGALAAYTAVNQAGLAWFQWRSDEAYRRIIWAQRRFAQQSDLRGLALADEWLGYMLQRSQDPDPALVHLRRARQLYLQVGDSAGAERVAAFGVSSASGVGTARVSQRAQ